MCFDGVAVAVVVVVVVVRVSNYVPIRAIQAKGDEVGERTRRWRIRAVRPVNRCQAGFTRLGRRLVERGDDDGRSSSSENHVAQCETRDRRQV